jgi:3-oxoacyl-[acyl-carrier-protein] synthase III
MREIFAGIVSMVNIYIFLNTEVDAQEVVEKALKKINLQKKEIDFLVTHQPVSWAPDTWRKCLDIPKNKFYHSFGIFFLFFFF